MVQALLSTVIGLACLYAFWRWIFWLNDKPSQKAVQNLMSTTADWTYKVTKLDGKPIIKGPGVTLLLNKDSLDIAEGLCATLDQAHEAGLSSRKTVKNKKK